MFTRKEQLEKKGGKEERFCFLKQLHNEYMTTKSHECKLQVLANLANFAYDPINFEFIKKLRIIDLFLAELSENSEELTGFAIGGICNLCIDPENVEYIVKSNGVHLISELLHHRNEEISMNALTSLIYLINSENQHLILIPEIINKVLFYQKCEDLRLKNLSTIFLRDFCTQEQILQAENV